MPYSSGTFSLVAGNPVVTGTTISSTWANNTLSDIASNGLTLCLLKDGTQTPTANIPFGGFRLTGIGAPTATGDALREGSAIGATTPAAVTATSLSVTVGAITGVGRVHAYSGTAPPAGGTVDVGIQISNVSSFGIFFGTGAPTLNAAKGSVYLRRDGTGTGDRLYVNTDGGGTWTAVTTAA